QIINGRDFSLVGLLRSDLHALVLPGHGDGRNRHHQQHDRQSKILVRYSKQPFRSSRSHTGPGRAFSTLRWLTKPVGGHDLLLDVLTYLDSRFGWRYFPPHASPNADQLLFTDALEMYAE